MTEGDLIQLDYQGRLHKGSGISLEPLQMSKSSPSKESVEKFYANDATQTVFDNIVFSSFVHSGNQKVDKE